MRSRGTVRRVLHENGLSITLFSFFIILLVGQSIVGHRHYNQEQQEHGQLTSTYVEYVTGSHFLEATMENWESEFLQMFFYVVLTAFLYQKGSAESKDPDKTEEVDENPEKSKPKPDAPWPVRKGGLILKLYQHSLSLALLLLFLISFLLHAAGGKEEYNQDQREHGGNHTVSVVQYMGTSRFWFESFQNWQSEFVAVFSMVVLSIFLRQKGSVESKPVDAANSETGKG